MFSSSVKNVSSKQKISTEHHHGGQVGHNLQPSVPFEDIFKIYSVLIHKNEEDYTNLKFYKSND